MMNGQPSINGPGIESWVALLQGDYSPLEYAEHVNADGMLPSAEYYAAWMRAGKLFRASASLDDPEDCGASLFLIENGRRALREALLVMLERRACPCCVELRRVVENVVERNVETRA
jgi:hypothetical protein